MDAATIQTFIELLCGDYIINYNQQSSLETLYSLTPDNPLYDIEMCKVMQEALHDLERIRNGEIKGEEEILRVWNKYRDRIAAAYPEEYKDLINQGTPPNPDARSMTLQNFATLKALALQSLADLDNYNLVLGACPRLMEQTFTNYIAHEITGHGGHGISLVERGLTYQQDVVSIAFNALSATDKGSRETHHKEKMNEFGTSVGEGFNRDMVASINAINIFFSGELCYSVHEKPMLLLLGTPKAEEYMFDSESIGTDGCKTCRLDIAGPAIPHSQGWFEDFIKSNYTDEEKAQICAIMWRFYLPLLQRLGIGKEESITTVRTRIAHKWGKVMSKEEIEAKQQNRREIGQRASKAWAAYMNDKANADQIKYVESTFFGKSKLAWEMWHEDPSALLQNLELLVVLVKGSTWKAHKSKLFKSSDEDALSRAALIPTLEATASAEVERMEAEKERIKVERERVRLENISMELESIEKIPVTERTHMHTIRYNLLHAKLSNNRREQVRWRERHTKEKKRLAAVKAATKRQKIEDQIKSLSTIKRTEEEEFQFNVLKAELRGDKNKVKRLKIEKNLKAIPLNNRTKEQQFAFDLLSAELQGNKNEVKRLKIEKELKSIPADNRTELQQIRFDLLTAQLRGNKNEVKRLKIEKKAAEQKRKKEKAASERLKIEKELLQGDKKKVKRLKCDKKARRDDKAEVNRLKIDRIKLLQEQQVEQIDKNEAKQLKSLEKEQKEKELVTQQQKQVQTRYDWYEQRYKPKLQRQPQQQQLIQQQQQQLVQQQNLLHYEEQQLNLSIEQQHCYIQNEEQHSNMKEEQQSRVLHLQQQLHYQKERLLQIQQRKQQNMLLFMQLQSQQQYQTQTALTSSQAKKPKPKVGFFVSIEAPIGHTLRMANELKNREWIKQNLRGSPTSLVAFLDSLIESFESSGENQINTTKVTSKANGGYKVKIECKEYIL